MLALLGVPLVEPSGKGAKGFSLPKFKIGGKLPSLPSLPSLPKRGAHIDADVPKGDIDVNVDSPRMPKGSVRIGGDKPSFDARGGIDVDMPRIGVDKEVEIPIPKGEVKLEAAVPGLPSGDVETPSLSLGEPDFHTDSYEVSFVLK